MDFITEKEKQDLIKKIDGIDITDEDESFDLGKLLRDYGILIMARCITNSNIIKERLEKI